MFQNNFLFYLLRQLMFRTVLSDQMTGDISKIHFTVKYLMTVDISESVYLIWQQVTSQRNLLEHLMSVFSICYACWCFRQLWSELTKVDVSKYPLVVSDDSWHFRQFISNLIWSATVDFSHKHLDVDDDLLMFQKVFVSSNI